MNESKYSNELPILVMNHDSIGTNDNGINNEGDQNVIDGQDDVDGKQVKRSMSLSAAEVKEQASVKLHYELKKAQEELKLRDAEVAKLNGIKDKVEAELEDLTASLFEEANKMVYDANVSRSKCEKELQEANMKIEVLQAEVHALKELVLTSTPSKPNVHLHPQLSINESSTNQTPIKNVKSLLGRSHSASRLLFRRSPSNNELSTLHLPNLPNESNSNAQNGHDNDGVQIVCEECERRQHEWDQQHHGEVDPIFYDEYTEWKKSSSMSLDPIQSPFIKRIYDEEIYPLFNFKNSDLTSRVLRSIEDGSIIIEAVGNQNPFPKRCALLDSPRNCRYRMKIADEWFNISLLCRNRITAVCDLFCYLRYIQRGLVKSGFHDVYWEIMRKRRNIASARLGFVTC